MRTLLRQVLERCHAVLQELPPHVMQRRPAATVESLQHMAACLTFHLAKVRACMCVCVCV